MQTDLLLPVFKDRLSELGYELVDLRVGGATHRPLLQVRIDVAPARASGAVTHGDCTRASRALEAWLDEEQAVGERYILEVSSPGIERPLKWIEHWRRFVGREASIRVAGRPRFRATIVRVPDDEHVVVESSDHGEETLAIATFKEAKLAADW